MTSTETKMKPQQYLHKLLTMKDCRPELKHITNEEWQDILTYMKSISIPTNSKKLKRCATTPIVMRRKWGLSDNDGVVDTLDNTYVRFINDVLGQIRKGKTDHCYYIYQISDLLRFEPDIDVELSGGIFYTSLNKK